MGRFTVAKLDEIPRRGVSRGWIPVRDHLGIGAFGVNAYRGEAVGDQVIGEHNELMAKHEELYVVVTGHATFTVDGDEIDAPLGTLVFVDDPATRRGAVAKEPGTIVLVTGARPGHAFEVAPWEDAWEENQAAMQLYQDKRYGEAAETLREAVKRRSDAAGLFYNLACFESMAHEDVAVVAEHLERAIDLYPGFRDFAREDSDLEPVRDEPAIQALVGEPA
jgi:hypothetical protein